MARLPVLSGKKLLRALEKDNFVVVRQKGSHVSIQKITPGATRHSIIPMHKDLAKGTLRDILNQCGISKERLAELLEK